MANCDALFGEQEDMLPGRRADLPAPALVFSAGSTLSERPPGQQRLQNQNVGFRFRAGIPLTSVQGL